MFNIKVSQEDGPGKFEAIEVWIILRFEGIWEAWLLQYFFQNSFFQP